MRIIHSDIIEEAVKNACIEANCVLSDDMLSAVKSAMEKEKGETGKSTLSDILKNAEIAKEKMMPICQDTGMAVFHVQLGKDVFIEGKSLPDAVNEGVKRGYTEGYLRKSVVADPLFRTNTNDNTPAVIYTDITDGDRIVIEFAPKGFGSENKSALRMLVPADGREEIVNFVVDTVSKAGPNPCPPMVVGVGIGGTFDKAAQIAKFALMRPVSLRNQNPFYAELEEEILKKINDLGIGPAGLGGNVSALAVNIETYPTHIAGLPVAVNISCHATRHKKIIL